MANCTARGDFYNNPCPYAQEVEGRPYTNCTAEGGALGEQCADYIYEVGELNTRNERGKEMNRCPNSNYDGIKCPYALSESSPLPCFGSPEQCETYRAKIEEYRRQGIDPFRPVFPTSVVKQVKEKVPKVKVNSILYGIEVNEE
jgi:hypothetical protein